MFDLFDRPRDAYTASLLAAARRLHQTKSLGGAVAAQAAAGGQEMQAGEMGRIVGGRQCGDAPQRHQGEERDRIWEQQKQDYPQFAGYEEATTRTIPVVILERVS